MDINYDVYSEFDLESHKKKFKHYLEVVIDADGTVMYAVPSHQEKSISIACHKLQVTRDELMNMCPREYYADFAFWLSKVADIMLVWTENYICANPTQMQKNMLRLLKHNGIYEGPLIYKDDDYLKE